MQEAPPHKRLEAASFAAHVARGVIRDRRTRRATMFVLLLLAAVMLALGTTILEGWLNAREHILRFALFWLACAWFTVTALLLAIFDILMVRAEARAARKSFREELRK